MGSQAAHCLRCEVHGVDWAGLAAAAGAREMQSECNNRRHVSRTLSNVTVEHGQNEGTARGNVRRVVGRM